MKYRFILILGLFFCSVTFASQNPLTCLASISCNYDTGECTMPEGHWILDSSGAQEPLSSSKPIAISQIRAYKTGDASGYQFSCVYPYGNYSTISTYTYAKTLIGENWVYSGFGKQRADCSQPKIPSSCAGQN